MLNSHPFFFIFNDFLMKRTGNLDNYTFHFSKYIYIPDSVEDKRYCFTMKGSEFTEERINQELAALSPSEELAFHSKIKVNNKIYHFPFIDFSILIDDWDFERDFIRLKRLIPHAIMKQLVLFNSGRSLHAYSLKLLSTQEWIDFMGRLLLVDLSSSSYKLIDSRWVGHRLIGRYSSLRWSNNSGKYLSEPARISNLGQVSI